MTRPRDPEDEIDHLVYTKRITPDQASTIRRLRDDLRRRRELRELLAWCLFCLAVIFAAVLTLLVLRL